MSTTKNVLNAITDEVVDTTQPVEDLVKFFVITRHKIFKSFYFGVFNKHIYGGGMRPHFLNPCHPMNAFHKDWDGVLPSKLFEPFFFKSTLPTVMTNARNIGSQDPLLRHMIRKDDWQSEVNNVRRTAAFHISGNVPLNKVSSKVWHCPKALTDLTVMLEEDPSPLFDDSYNWHYAGSGNLQVLAVGDEDCVLHSELNRLYLSKFSRRRLRVKRKYIFSYDCGEGNNILETICNTQYIALRFMQKVLLLRIIEKDGAINVKKIKEIEYDVIVTSIAFDQNHRNIMYITRVDNTASIVNLDIMKGRTIKLIETKSLVNNWGTVVSIDSDTYCHVGRKTVMLYDKRTNSSVGKWKKDLSSLESCDKFNVVKVVEDTSLMYLGTKHHIFLADLRNSTRFIQRWNHMMYCEPSYLSLSRDSDGNDMLVLASQWPEDTCVLLNKTASILKRGHSRQMYMPHQLPSVEQLLLEARQKMKCLDPYNPLSQRLYSALTGVALAAAGDNYLVLTQNALGDVFCNTLYPDLTEIEDDSVERLHEWSATLKDQSKVFDVTTVIDVADVWKTLKKVPDDVTIGMKPRWPHMPQKFSEQDAIATFESEDFDRGLLHAWDVETEPVLPVGLEFSDSE